MEAQTPDSPETARPIEYPRARVGSRGRLYAAVVLLACAGAIALAVWLTPDPRGYGTHQQFGFGKCGMLITTGLPCPTCGMTTAFAYTVRGRLISAFLAQPAGFLLALAIIACAIGAGWVLVIGRIPRIACSLGYWCC